jgi:hypothetical protein
MGMLDHLITKGEEPLDMEYLYTLDLYWIDGDMTSYPIEKYTIVTNVKQNIKGGYTFTIKNTNIDARSNYAWAFVEHTKENLDKIKIYEEEYKKFLSMKKKVNILRKNIKSLEL